MGWLLCFFGFHKWTRWRQVGYTGQGVTFRQRQCRRCRLIRQKP